MKMMLNTICIIIIGIISNVLWLQPDWIECEELKLTTPVGYDPGRKLWNNFENSDTDNWNIKNFAISTPMIHAHIPFADHTLRTEEGHFAIIDSRNTRLSNGYLEASNPYDKQTKQINICFSFWFFFYGHYDDNLENASQLEVFLLYDSKPIKRVYRSLEDLIIRWQEALIDIPVDSMDFDKILVNGTVFSGTLAIDDLKMKMGYCISKESQVQSDFEDGSSTDMFMPDATWKVHQGSETKIHLPDHTTRTLDGHFYGVYMDSTINPTAKILTKTNSTFDLFASCLVFSYYLIGENVSLFYGYEFTEGNIKFEQWLVQGKSASNQWFTHKETINKESWGRRTMRLIFGVQFTSAINNHAAFIDDVHLMKMSCGQESPECDFESSNYCTLEVVHPKSLNNWIPFESLANRGNLTTMSLDYLTGHVNEEWHVYSPRMDGPYIKQDNTMGNEYGNYFLLEQNNGQNRAIFITDRYAINTTGGTADRQNFCLEIYVVKPTEVSYIEVYQSESPDHNGLGWKLFGTNESFQDWHRLQIMARPQYSNSVDIYFFIIATTLNPRAYVAVDDFLVQQKQCPDPSNVLPTLSPPTGPTVPTTTPADHITTPFHGFHNGKFYCNPSDSISVEKVCDQVEDCLNGLDEKECGDCLFERHDLCGYKIIGNSDDEQDQEQFEWRFSDQSKYGPNDFHVHDSMTASGRKVKTFDPDVWLMTPYIQRTYLRCFVDFYYLYNTTWPGINDRFKLKLRTSDWHTTTVWQSSLEPLRPGEWYPIRVHLNRINHDFQLIFDALPLGPQPRSSSSGSGSGSYHSIRYVRMLSCGPKTPISPTETCYGFLCKNRVCIDKSSVCDFDDDCGDGSDEQGCDPNLMTDFQSDSGLGRWGTLYFRNWKLTEADKQSDLRLAPTFDHTTRFMSGGKYLLNNEGPGAIIDGPPMVINSGCRVSMFVMKNSKNSTLMMKLLDLQTGSTRILRTIDDFTDYFQNFYWMAGSNFRYNSIYKILLETTLTNTSDNFMDPYVAVDDISFSSSCTILDHDPINVTTTSPNDTCLGILCMDEHHKQICVVEAQICDFIPQCANGQDESQCGDCNFNEENNLCGWTQYSQSSVSVVWSVFQPASATPNRYMKQDADGNPNGGYLASSYAAHKQYFKYLRSPQINGRTSEFCQMTFQYACLERIAASIYVDYEHILIKDLKCEQNKWQLVRLDIGAHEPGFGLFVEIQSFGADNIVEIDNFKLHNCSTLHQNDTEPQPIKNLDCDFETGVCGWNIGNNQTRGHWFRTNSFSLEPGIDHTSLIIPMPAKHGTWLTTQANIQMDTPIYNVLQSDRPILADPSNNGYCMRFWYYFFGLQQAKFYVNVWSADPKHPAGKTLWTRVQPVARDWSEGLIDIPRQQANFHISIVADVSSTVIVGLDDISFLQGPCKATDPMFCDFELNLCNWKLHSGSMKITQDGVTSDHTTGTVYGHFMEQPMTQNQVISAIIQDIHHENQQQSCLSLYYYFDAGNGQNSASEYSSGNGQLSVQLFENDEWSTLKNISMVDVIGVNQQNIWTLLSVSFWMGQHASLMIQITQNQQSILIDDVRYLEHFCDSFSGACDFESDMCGWFNGKQTQNLMLWIRVTPRNTFVKRNGVPYDHTTKTDHGFYLALALDMHRAIPTESSVVLRSVLVTRLQRDVAVCFRMFFFARVLTGHNGTEVMRVQLVDPQKQGKVLQEVPVLASPMGDYNAIDWVLFQMEVENLPPVYEFVIVTKYNQFIISDIGIDDITIKHERCFDHSHTPFTSTTPLPDQEKVADCDFEPLSQMCHWTYQHNIWTVTSYDKQNDPYAPAMDHTVKSSSGHYLLYKNDTNSGNPSEQWLISPSMNWDRKRCLSFWYYADGGLPFDVGQIDVMLETNGEVCLTTHLNEYRFLHTQSWQLIRLTIPFRERFNNETMRIKINYKLFTESQNASAADYSSFAIDDIRMRPGICGHHHDYTYTFTDGVEDLLMEQIHPPGQYKGHVLNYRQAMAAKLVPDDVPKQDHTTYSIDYGYYFGFLNLNSETSNTTYVSDLSIVDVPADQSQRSCIRFAYQAIGNIARSLQISISDKESDDGTSLSSPLRWSNVAEKPWWTVVELDKQIDYKHSILFRMIKSFDHDSFIALDDLTVMDRQCQQPFDCDFNQDHYCSYTDYLDKMTNQAFRIYASWMANIHPDFPGPSLDHSGTKGNGYLMLTGWRSSGQSDHEQLRAKMVSGSIELREREPGNYCLSWWSWINEVEASIMINLLRFQNGKYAGLIPLATIKEVVHKKWTQTMITLNETFLKDYEEMQLLLEGEINDSRQAFIAIDDIELSKGVCPEPTFKCLNNKVLSIDQRCDFRRDCPSGWDELGCGDKCTFETGMCGWDDIGHEDMDHWEKESVVHFLTVDPGHAPKFDASGDKAGHYVMMRRSDRVHSKTGHAEMALNYKYRDYYFKHSWKTCILHFDYYTEASERFYLKARFGDEIHNLDTFHILAPRKGSTNGGWTHVSAQIGLRWSPFLVDFNAFDDSILSVIAVDNIDFKDCQTPKPLAHGGVCPPETPILCNQTRICIDQSDLCDGINDCGEDAEDESARKCGFEQWRRCSFESFDRCELNVANDDDSATKWIIATGHEFEDDKVTPGYEPLIDNTRRNRNSPYALLKTKPGFSSDHSYSSTLFTPVFRTTDLNATNPCRLRFFYYWHSDLDIIKKDDLSLEVFAQYLELDDSQVEPEKSEILWKMDATQVLLQQSWTKAVINFPYWREPDFITHQSQPFRFALRAWIKKDQRARVAIDDLSYDFNCQRNSMPTSPTDNPIFTTSTTANPNSSHYRGKTGIVVMSITIMVVVAFIFGIIIHRKYYYNRSFLGRFSVDGDRDDLVMSMKSLRARSYENK